jgi:dTDP-glucose 4,6-dehydratase
VKNYMPKKMLVTGGAGFIGSHYVHHALTTHPQLEIINLDLLTYAGSLDNLLSLPDPTRHHFVQGNICDTKLVAALLAQHEIDTIVHFAAESHVDRSIENPMLFVETNVLGTLSLLEAAREYWLVQRKLLPEQCRFHHISTDEVYGTLTEVAPAFTETTPYAPNSPYSASKAGSDHLVRAYAETYQLPVTLTNCSNNYGPHQHPEKLIPTIMRACLENSPIPIYGNGTNRRDWLYVKDHCIAIDLLIQKGTLGESYNIGGNAECSNLEIAQKICAIFDEVSPGKQPYENLITFVQDRPGHDWRYAMDIGKISQALGWNPATRLEAGLRETVKFFISQL